MDRDGKDPCCIIEMSVNYVEICSTVGVSSQMAKHVLPGHPNKFVDKDEAEQSSSFMGVTVC